MHAVELGYMVLPLPAQMLSVAERPATSSKCWAIKSRALACTDTDVRVRTHWYLAVWHFINCSKLFQLHQAIHVYVYM
jgi:hypothetical protein